MTVKLIKPHTHAGKDYAPGETIDLDESTARWLIEQGVAKDAPPSTLPPGEGPVVRATSSEKPNRKGD